MIRKIFLILICLFSFILFVAFVTAPSLNCFIVAAGSCTNTTVLYLENETGGYNNAHAQNVSEASYSYVVCCDADAIGGTITTACGTAFLNLSAVTNAHVQIPMHNTYGVGACMYSENNSIQCTNRTGSCSANETCLVSIASSESDNTTNAHVASCDYYLEQICCALNSKPSTTVPVIVPDPAYTTDTLNCSFTVTDAEQTSLYANYTWYKNDSDVISAPVSGQVSVTNNTAKMIQLLYGNTTKHEFWICEITPYDGGLYGDAKNSSAVEIINTPPCTVDLIEPATESHTTDRTPLFNWTACPADPDGDPIEYVLNLTCRHNAGGSCSPLDDNFIENITDSNYTPSDANFLRNFWDTLEFYNWTIKAWDAEEYGNVSDEWRFYIDSLVAITVINDTVNFGSLTLDQSDNTTDNIPFPISMFNDGNCFINVSLNGTALWQSVAFPSSDYQFKTDYSESNSFNWAQSITSWTNTPSSTLTSIAELNWSNSTDSYEADISVVVPSDEPPGNKGSILTFTGFFVDVAE